ncbi:hypothetical protein CRG98_029135 [Punica granatum]|uniref:Uncharacterized protein n=1 Tax=Punica granatum TaxID=22663 RepID=A0A2I0J413_PUNGR|nr:hypothetical protein CRG98_029135 [Punica granatum]
MCHFSPRLRRVVPSRSKGPSRPTISPVKRWSRSESLSTVHNPRSTLSLLSGLGTFAAVHDRLDPSLSSPRSLILHRAVVRASVPTPFSSRCFTGVFALDVQPSLATLIATSSTPFLWEMTHFEVGETLVVREGRGNSRPCLLKGWPRVLLPLMDARGTPSPRSLLLPTPYHPKRRVTCGHDEKYSGSRGERPFGSAASRDVHGYPPCKGAERSLGLPEASDLLFHDVVCFS